MNKASIIKRKLLNMRFAFLPHLKRALQMPSLVDKHRNRGTDNSLKQLQIAVSIIENYRCLSSVSNHYSPLIGLRYGNQATYHKLLLRTDTRIGSEDWPAVYSNKRINALHEFNVNLVKPHLKNKRVTLIIDLTPINVWGKHFEAACKGYGLRPLGYQLGVVYAEVRNGAFWLHHKLAPGNAVSKNMFHDLFNYAVNVLSSEGAEVSLLLIDAGFFSWELVDELTHRGIRFIMRIPTYTEAPELQYKGNFWISTAHIVRNGTQYLVIRVRVKERDSNKIVTYYLITNIKRWSARRIVKRYRTRWRIENMFKELKYDFHLKLPSRNFVANLAYIELLMLAFNVFRLAVKDKRLRRMLVSPTMRRFSQYLLWLGYEALMYLDDTMVSPIGL